MCDFISLSITVPDFELVTGRNGGFSSSFSFLQGEEFRVKQAKVAVSILRPENKTLGRKCS